MALLALVHLAIFPLVTASYGLVFGRTLDATLNGEPLSLPDVQPGQHLRMVVINPPIAALIYYYPLVRAQHGLHNPASLHALANGDQPLHLTVVDAHTIELSGPKGFMDSLNRDTVRHPLKTGDRLPAGVLTVTVLSATPQGVPTRARFHFHSALSDPAWRFFVWSAAGYQPFALPTPGHSLTLPRADVGQAILRRWRQG